MRDKHYKTKSFKISEEVYLKLKKDKEEKDISWNLFFKELVENKSIKGIK